MLRKLLLAGLASLFMGAALANSSWAASASGSTSAQQAEFTQIAGLKALSVKADAPKRYEVKQGDSLWEIAARFLDDPWMWPQLWQANKQVINPHLLYPGDVIELLDRQVGLRLVPRLRILTLQEPIPFMPLARLGGFLSRDVMIDRPEFEDALYTVHIRGERQFGSKGDELEVLGKMPEEHSGYFGIYRNLEEVRDPLTRRILGFHAKAIGTARLTNAESKLPRLEVIESQEEIRIGDRLLPLEENPFGTGFQPQHPNSSTFGTVLGGLKQQELIGNYDLVMLNVGAEKLQPGYLLEVIAPGKRMRNYSTGEVIFAGENRKGTLMVYRVFDNISFALVMQAEKPLTPGDIFRRTELN